MNESKGLQAMLKIATLGYWDMDLTLGGISRLGRHTQNPFLIRNPAHDRIQNKPAQGAALPFGGLADLVGLLAAAADQEGSAIGIHGRPQRFNAALCMMAEGILPVNQLLPRASGFSQGKRLTVILITAPGPETS
jgi:hypothetical protein